MKIVKSLIIGLLAQAAMAGAGYAQAQTQRAPFETTKIAEGVYQFRYGGHNSMFVVTPQGVIVTDPISLRRPEAAVAYLAEIRKITQAPIRYLIYSHSHFDHSSGGKVFKDAGAIVIAHENARARLAKVSRPDIVVPDQIVHDRHRISLGGVTLDLIYLGRNHSDNSLVMLLPKERIVFAVDWATPGNAISPLAYGDADLPEWREGLRRLAALDWDRMIGGHGPRLGTKADVQMQIDFMGDAEAQARELADAGRCNAEGRAAVAVPAKFNGYANTAQWTAALDRYCTFWNQGY